MEEFIKHLNELIIKAKLKIKEIYTNYKEASVFLGIIFFIIFINLLPLLIFILVIVFFGYFIYFIYSNKSKKNLDNSLIYDEKNNDKKLFNISNKNFFETNLGIKIIFIYKIILGFIFKLFLFLVLLSVIIYTFLPKDIKSNFEDSILEQLFQIRLDFTDIDYTSKVDKLFIKHCGQYVNRDICEIELFYSISMHGNKNEELYNYCIKKENSTKKYCQSGYSHMTAGVILNKLPTFEIEFNKWKIENNIDLDIKINIPDYSKIYESSISPGLSIQIFDNNEFSEKFNNSYFISKGISEKAFYKYYGEKSFAIDIVNIDLEDFREILSIIKEEINKIKNKSIVSEKKQENISSDVLEDELNNLGILEERKKIVDYMYSIIDNHSTESIKYDIQNNTTRKYFFDKDYNGISYGDINKKNIIWGMGVMGLNGRNLDDIIIVVGDLSKYKKEDTIQSLEILGTSMKNLNGKDFSKLGIPKVIDGGKGRDILFITGDTNLTNTDISNIEDIIIF